MGNGSSVEPAKVIFVDILGQQEKIILSRTCNASDIEFLLRQAAGVTDRYRKLTVKNSEGAVIPISPEMPINSQSNPYKVELSENRRNSCTDEDSTDWESIDTAVTQVIEKFNRVFKVEELQMEFNNRLKTMEKKFESDELTLVDIDKCRRDIQEIKGLIYSQRTSRLTSPLSDDIKICLKRGIPSYPKYTLSKETADYLKQPTFDMWHWEPNEMLSLLEHMYHELGLVKEFNINPVTLKRWLLRIQEKHRNNPFHNFRHSFCVAQMMYGFIHLCHLWNYLSTEDLGILLTSCICHDLDHPGYSNTYQVNAKTELAARYGNDSPLERHHCDVAFRILGNQSTNLFSNADRKKQETIRNEMSALILATDMAKHSEYMEQFNRCLENFSFRNQDHLNALKIILVKACDISNEIRPLEVSEPWLDCLLEEYFNQSDREKSEGLPFASFMDRDRVTKPSTQLGFIDFVLLPMFEAVAKLFPKLTTVMVNPLIEARDRYETLNKTITERN